MVLCETPWDIDSSMTWANINHMGPYATSREPKHLDVMFSAYGFTPQSDPLPVFGSLSGETPLGCTLGQLEEGKVGCLCRKCYSPPLSGKKTDGLWRRRWRLMSRVKANRPMRHSTTLARHWNSISSHPVQPCCQKSISSE